MMVTRHIHIEPADRPALEQAGLASFETLMTGNVGEIIKRKPLTSVSRLSLPVGTFYLKRSTGDGWRRVARMLFRGRAPRVSCWREGQMVRALGEAGFAVMRPAAWGEQRCMGIGRQGFLLVHAVPGRGLDDVFNHGNAATRRGAMTAFGTLMGRLHAAGFYPSLRLRDLMVPDAATDPMPLVMIDCEAARPEVRPFDERSCCTVLAKCYLKNLSLIARPLSPREQLRLLRAYRLAVAPRWSIGLRELAEEVRQVISLFQRSNRKYRDR